MFSPEGSSYSELINPVVSSAKGSLDMLLAASIPEAQKLAELIDHGIPEKTARILQGNPSLGSAIAAMYALRYNAINYYIERTGIKNVVDLGCGYSPRGLLFLDKPGYTYVGVDLPAVIQDVRKVNGNIHYQTVDITNGAALKKVFSKLEGKVLILTEDVLPYLTVSELKTVINNIHDVLLDNLGIWMTADFEGSDYTSAVLKSFFDEGREAKNNPAVCVDAGPDYLEECGFVFKRVPFLNEHILNATLACYPMEKILRISENYRSFGMSFYYLSKSEELLKEPRAETKVQTSGDFSFFVQKGDEQQTIRLSGRLDTVSSPELLGFYDKYCDFRKGLILDCQNLEYVSSAGLRVFLIMYKKNNQNVKLINTNEMVSEVLEQTGIGEYFSA